MIILFAVLIGCFLAYANGANDNFKGVATLFGSGVATFRNALNWATLAQVLGSVTALILAHGLLATFSGKGLVPDSVVAMKSFALAVGLGSAITVALATRLGFPVSTTHALTGALVGSGLLASQAGVNWSKLGSNFFTPLIVSPILAVIFGSILYLTLRQTRTTANVKKESCLCIGNEIIGVVPTGMNTEQATAFFSSSRSLPVITIGSKAQCVEKYRGNFLGLDVENTLSRLHYLSGGIVCFARALNDTPKVAATLLIGGAFSPSLALVGVGGVMALGGLLNSKKVAETMSLKVTTLNPGQGLSANLVTGFLVIFASKLGMPVSTTHVSCGALFGIGTVTRQANWKTILNILLAWVITLPVAALLGAGIFLALKAVL